MEKFGLLTFVLVLFLGIVSRQYVTWIPYTVIMMLCGGCVGAALASTSLVDSATLRAWVHMSPTVLLYTFIPILVFESAFMTDTHIFLRSKWQIFALAVPGVAGGAALTAAFAYYAFQQHYSWTWPECLMVGAILSATDPVAVVSLLKEIGVSERLATLIEGESLLNDGTAIVIFDIVYHALKHHPCNPILPTKAVDILIFLVRLGFLGPVLGASVGFCCTVMLGYVLNDPFNEIAITLLACFSAFGVAEGIVHTSGVLSVVSCGMYLSRYGRDRISAQVESSVHSFWSVLAHVANTAVFFLSGLIMAHRVLATAASNDSNDDDCYKCVSVRGFSGDDDGEETHSRFEKRSRQCASKHWIDLLYLFELYIALHAIRCVVLVCVSPVLKRGVYGFTPQQAAVVAYGGLRGAIGLILALIVDQTSGIEGSLKKSLLFQVSGIALLTLCVNGTTTKHLLHYLQLDSTSEAQDEIFAHVTMDVDRKLAREISLLKREMFLGDADWQMVWRYVPALSPETYWLRIVHRRISLSQIELEDLRRRQQPRGESTSSFSLPPLLQARWTKYHKRFSAVVPRFVKSRHSIGDDFEQILKAVKTADRREKDDAHCDATPASSPRVGLPSTRLADTKTHFASSESSGLPTCEIPAATKRSLRRSSKIVSAVAKRVFGSINASSPRPRSSEEAAVVPKAYSPNHEGVCNEARSRIMWVVKANYHLAFSRGRLSPTGLRVLRENADMQCDNDQLALDEWERLLRFDLARLVTLERIRDVSTAIMVPFLRHWLDGYVFRQLAFVFEVAYNFVNAHEDVDVAEIVDDELVSMQLVEEITAQQNKAKSTISEYVSIFPEVANAVKTQIAARYVLIKQQEMLQELREHGHVAEKELDACSKAINSARLELRRHPYAEAMPSLLDTLLALQKSNPLLTCLGQHLPRLVNEGACREEVLPANTILAKKGRYKPERHRHGLFVVVRGSIKADENVLLGSGQSCCVEEQLLDIPFTSTCTAVSMVRVVYFERRALLALAHRNTTVRKGMWWNVALRVLKESPCFGCSSSHLESLRGKADFVFVEGHHHHHRHEDNEEECESPSPFCLEEHDEREEDGLSIRTSRSSDPDLKKGRYWGKARATALAAVAALKSTTSTQESSPSFSYHVPRGKVLLVLQGSAFADASTAIDAISMLITAEDASTRALQLKAGSVACILDKAALHLVHNDKEEDHLFCKQRNARKGVGPIDYKDHVISN